MRDEQFQDGELPARPRSSWRKTSLSTCGSVLNSRACHLAFGPHTVLFEPVRLQNNGLWAPTQVPYASQVRIIADTFAVSEVIN